MLPRRPPLPLDAGNVSASGLIAHEGSHVEDMQSIFNGGPSISHLQSETKAYETQAAVINDFAFWFSGASFNLSDNGVTASLMNPFDSYSRQANHFSIDRLLANDPRYGLTQPNDGGPIAVRP